MGMGIALCLSDVISLHVQPSAVEHLLLEPRFSIGSILLACGCSALFWRSLQRLACRVKSTVRSGLHPWFDTVVSFTTTFIATCVFLVWPTILGFSLRARLPMYAILAI